MKQPSPPKTAPRKPWSFRNPGKPRDAGFTLNEVLIAVGILAIGITAVASLLPTAILLQKETVRDTLRVQYIRSAEAVLRGKGLSANELFEFTDNVDAFPASATPRLGQSSIEFDVFALSEVDTDPGNNTATPNTPDARPSAGSFTTDDSLLNNWPVEDRSFPSYITLAEDRELFVVPLFQRGEQATREIADWTVFIMVMEATEVFANAHPTDPLGTPATAICANPELAPAATPPFASEEDYSPKVFRARVDVNANTGVIEFEDNWDGRALFQPGDLVLGNTGAILRINQVFNTTPMQFTANVDTRQDNSAVDTRQISSAVDNLEAVWFAMPAQPSVANPNPSSPIRDIRIISQSVVQTNF
ncbi:MAG: prepilin-type N-terminal cleavage/methylation domain-containing protein [Planctomycetota bacterium]